MWKILVLWIGRPLNRLGHAQLDIRPNQLYDHIKSLGIIDQVEKTRTVREDIPMARTYKRPFFSGSGLGFGRVPFLAVKSSAHWKQYGNAFEGYR